MKEATYEPALILRKTYKIMKRNLVILFIWTVFLLGVLLAPTSEMDIFILWGFKYFDKVAHFCLFAVTGFVSVFGATFFRQFRSRIYFGIALGLILALGTEFAQSLLSFRSTSLYDLLADVAGLGIGLALYVPFIRYKQRV